MLHIFASSVGVPTMVVGLLVVLAFVYVVAMVARKGWRRG